MLNPQPGDVGKVSVKCENRKGKSACASRGLNSALASPPKAAAAAVASACQSTAPGASTTVMRKVARRRSGRKSFAMTAWNRSRFVAVFVTMSRSAAGSSLAEAPCGNGTPAFSRI